MIMLSLNSETVSAQELDTELSLQVAPSYTFLLNPKTKRIKNLGTCIDENALRQSIYFMLMTRRYAYEIYSRDYGAEFWNYFGEDNDDVLMPVKIQEDITETLVTDDRISNVTNFIFTRNGERLAVTFTVEYDLGNGEEETEVTVEINEEESEVNVT